MASGYFDFVTDMRGFHVYRDIWKPKLYQLVTCKRERNNVHHCFAIAGMTKVQGTLAPSIIGHIPRELSRYIWFAIKRGATIQAKVISTKEKASTLKQGGLEVPICVEIVWGDTVSMEKLKTKVDSLDYKIDVDYVDDSKDILKGILAEDMEESDEEIEAKEVVEQDNTVVIM